MHFWDFHTHQSGLPHAIYQAETPASACEDACSVGIHPWRVGLGWEEEVTRIQEYAQGNEQVLAIGEAGFDRLKGPDIPLQKEVFYDQARVAADLGIPLILHCVKAHDLLLQYLKSAKNPPCIIWHGWNQKPELAGQLLPFPIFFSFGKHILHPGSNAAKWLAACPIERIFFETDDSGVEIGSIYQGASLLLQLPVASLAAQVVVNWNAISKRKIA
jgi:TatD DNase family protein